MKNIFCLLLLLLSATACRKETAPHEDTETLYWRFHGKYKAVRSTSSEPVDVNFDGQASADLLEELPDLSRANVEILVNRYRRQGPGGKSLSYFTFSQFWPEQSLSAKGGYDANPTSYDPEVSVSYLLQGVIWGFDFDPLITRIHLRPEESSASDPARWPPPESITLEANNEIRVATRKRLYTREGWKTVEIVTLYRRYTMDS